MKSVYKFLGYLFLGFVSLGCFDQPQFSEIPAIELEDLYFGDSIDPPGELLADSIVVKIKFKDGDGDLGLGEDEINPPYNKRDFYVDDDEKLVTIRTRTKPCCTDLPTYEEGHCKNYTQSTESLIFESVILDNTYNIVDTLFFNNVRYYEIKDTVYFEPNENHYNITLEFLIKENGVFRVFDWLTEVPNLGTGCGEGFDGRFDRFPNEGNAMEGIISYSMNSVGFKTLFGIRPLKLRISIRDRALNKSNVLETAEFTLQGIKR